MSDLALQFPVRSALPPIGTAVEWTGNHTWPGSAGVVVGHSPADKFSPEQTIVLLDDGGRHYVRRFEPADYKGCCFKITGGKPCEVMATHARERYIAWLANAKDEQAKRKAAQEARAALILKGKELAKTLLPAGCERVIVARMMEDKSDSMTDYYASHAKGLVVLAYSMSKRDNFSEMRKAAKRFKPTAAIPAEGAGAWVEHREKYSMGAGYYMSTSDYSHASGWEVRKSWLGDDVYYSLATLHCLDTAERTIKPQA